MLEAAPFGAPVGGPYPVHTDVDDVSWDLSGVYALNEDVNLYARVAKGFRAPSIQGRLLFAAPGAPNGGVSTADSEEVISYEAGIKADLWDRRARIGFNVFRYDVNDQQLIAVGGGANTATLLNADKTIGQGFELDLQAYLTDNLLVTLGSSYNDTEIDDPEPGRARLRRRLHRDRPGNRARLRPLHHRRQFAAAGAQVGAQPHRALGHAGRQGRVLRLHRLGLSQRGQLLPVRIEGVPRQGLARRRPARRLQLAQRRLRGGRVRPQHHRHRPASSAASTSTT